MSGMSKRGQKVLSYVIFHRHGQRAPTKNIYSASDTKPQSPPLGTRNRDITDKNQAETDMWHALLAPTQQLSALEELYPVRRHPQREMQSDLTTKPFGCVTEAGLQHLEQQGRATQLAFPSLAKVKHFEVFSTNYQRTQASAQAFLKGLGAPAGTTVEVLDSQACPLSFYDHDPALAVRLTKQVQSTAMFQQEESKFVDSHGADLVRAVPELATTRDVYTFNIPVDDSDVEEVDEGSLSTEEDFGSKSGSTGGGFKINWMAALDYFACRSAHQLPLHPQVDRVDDQGEHFGTKMKEYVGSRYKLYYGDREMLRAAVEPMLRGVVLEQFSRAAAQIQSEPLNGSAGDTPPTALIYSGHDVNLMGLLVALRASLVHKEKNHWPEYGSSLVFELVQPRGVGDSSELDRRVGELLVNVYYNHEPLSFRLPPPAGSGGGGKTSHCMHLADLRAFCDTL